MWQGDGRVGKFTMPLQLYHNVPKLIVSYFQGISIYIKCIEATTLTSWCYFASGPCGVHGAAGAWYGGGRMFADRGNPSHNQWTLKGNVFHQFITWLVIIITMMTKFHKFRFVNTSCDAKIIWMCFFVGWQWQSQIINNILRIHYTLVRWIDTCDERRRRFQMNFPVVAGIYIPHPRCSGFCLSLYH